MATHISLAFENDTHKTSPACSQRPTHSQNLGDVARIRVPIPQSIPATRISFNCKWQVVVAVEVVIETALLLLLVLRLLTLLYPTTTTTTTATATATKTCDY